jgi:hypothetical protein
MVHVVYAVTDVKYPEMRSELAQHLHALSDRGYQQRVWVEGRSEGTTVHDEFGYAVHFMYDDTMLASDPPSIGWILRNLDEANRISAVVTALDSVLNKYGMALSDADYVRVPEWDAVVEAARLAKGAIK